MPGGIVVHVVVVVPVHPPQIVVVQVVVVQVLVDPDKS
jgi:hypothetical protein